MTTPAPIPPAPVPVGWDGLVERVAAAAPRLDSVDGDVRETLHLLGEHRLLGPVPGRSGALAEAVGLIERIAGQCLSSAFAVWAQRMVADYLAHAVELNGPARACAA